MRCQWKDGCPEEAAEGGEFCNLHQVGVETDLADMETLLRSLRTGQVSPEGEDET